VDGARAPLASTVFGEVPKVATYPGWLYSPIVGDGKQIAFLSERNDRPRNVRLFARNSLGRCREIRQSERAGPGFKSYEGFLGVTFIEPESMITPSRRW
jgi:hypothetical protein